MTHISKLIFQAAFCCLFFVSFISAGQEIPGPAVDYRSAANPFYWKNKNPEPGYWQQDVHYEIKASIDDSTDIVTGESFKLTYWNNSPYTLNEMFFHLYQNAFVEGSHYHDLNENNEIEVKFGKYEKQGLGTTCENILVDGKFVKTELDNTILKVFLNKPIQPGDSVVVTMKFKTYFDTGTMRRRMKTYISGQNKHYDGVFWYPVVSVYDPKAGWTTDQHLDKEFYSNFGQYDVWLTFPQQYIVEATGNLMNEEEVIPADLKEKLKLSNYFTHQPGTPASVLIPAEAGKTKTWYFKAINVHNFAWTADPDYRMESIEWKGIKVIALAEEQNAPGWKGAAEFTRKVIEVYSRDFGMYKWPKIIVADAKDGMEYPMLTLDNGTYPSNQSLLAHEVGHMWFYGMVASNETYRASMDEGFTQFLTVWSMDKILGERRDRMGRSKWVTQFLEPSVNREERLYSPYLNHVITGYDEPLNTHSNDFNGAIRHSGNYGLVYYKTGTMLYNLRYVLGDELFMKAMQHYVEKWKFAHPYPEDFRKAIIEYTQTDLNWFFDEWLETTKYIDYAVQKVKKLEGNKYEITFKRKGSMQMPLDIVVTTRDGQQFKYIIPNTWFVKNTDAVVLPKWTGWGLLHPEYKAVVELPSHIASVEIDPAHNLADIDLRNNKWGEHKINHLEFDSRVPNASQWTRQKNFYRPDIWYNGFDGIQFGPHLEGDYLKFMEYSATAWINSGLLNNERPGDSTTHHQWLAFNYSCKNNLTRVWKGLSMDHNGYYNAGIWKFGLGFSKEFKKQDERQPEYTTIFLNTKYLYNDLSYNSYLLYGPYWGPEVNVKGRFLNSTINAGVSRHYTYPKGAGDATLSVRTPSILSDYNYSQVELNSVNTFGIKKLDFKSRVFGQMGFGNIPVESQLYLAGANPEALIDNKFTRARGFFPSDWTTYGAGINHFQYGGGLNLRGYAGYLAPEQITSGGFLWQYPGYRGRTGAAWNLEMEFDKLIKIKPGKLTKNFHLDSYLFTDMGILGTRFLEKTRSGSFRMDAGIGTALTIKFSYFDIEPLVIRFDMPLFLNRPPAQENYFKPRYVLSVKRAF